MSKTFSLVCDETKQKVWVGQGWSKMTSFYSENPIRMLQLGEFLCENEGRPLKLLCEDTHDMLTEYTEYGDK